MSDKDILKNISLTLTGIQLELQLIRESLENASHKRDMILQKVSNENTQTKLY